MVYNVVKGLFIVFFRLFFPYVVEGRENIPQEGPLIICSNHISWMDPPLVGVVLTGKKVHFMAKAELFDIFIIGSIIKKVGAFPVKRDTADIKTIKTSIALLREKKCIVLFPEGTRSKPGEIRDALPGAALIALKSQAPILPVAIKGPYRLFRKTPIGVGKPITLDALYGQKAKREILQKASHEIMQEIRQIHARL